jgi:hypothetical protein
MAREISGNCAINPNRLVAAVFEHLLTSPRRVASQSDHFVVFAALAVRSFVGALASSGANGRIATDPIRSRETPAQHAWTSFRHPQGEQMGSRTLIADSTQTQLCAYLSASTLAGLAANAAFGWWWADPLAALVIAAVAIHEGTRSMARRYLLLKSS